MKIYKKINVFDAALERIRYIFDEFENVSVAFSGGKDSTVCLNLALIVAEEKKRLPLRVEFIDQEAEWQHVIDYMRIVMYDPRVQPAWYQMPIKLFNATSTIEPWLYCWDEAKKSEWIREKDPISIKVNEYGTDRFKALFKYIPAKEFAGKDYADIGGVRCEESPSRYVGLTASLKYKDITWGKQNEINKGSEKHFTFYPIYDWCINDVWKAIHSNHWKYCEIYDYFYRYGVPIGQMRVPNVHHETAVWSLFRLQEIEPETWERLVARLPGINTAGHVGKSDFYVKKLPFMFHNWREYRNFLVEKLPAPETRPVFKEKFEELDILYDHPELNEALCKQEVQGLIANDYEHTKLMDFLNKPEIYLYKKFKKGKAVYGSTNNRNTKYLPKA